ncbi:hypothetical protein Clow_00661 [Corynebacterium lowii]|uniref:Uncharacterized protein n=1 Tax=Corynebacterium lowii TaxID=1544413 RepID=A0A0Q0UMI2_9CORY|nr:hypothetical protein Clow_00661 [Corynebacterium lowii]
MRRTKHTPKSQVRIIGDPNRYSRYLSVTTMVSCHKTQGIVTALKIFQNHRSLTLPKLNRLKLTDLMKWGESVGNDIGHRNQGKDPADKTTSTQPGSLYIRKHRITISNCQIKTNNNFELVDAWPHARR